MTDRERLIELLKNAPQDVLPMCLNLIEFDCRGIVCNDCYGKFADHLLANGVIVPPCKVWDTVYKIWSCGKHGKSIAEFEVTHIDIDNLPEIEITFKKKNNFGCYYSAKLRDIGKTVFLTKEEAEQALKEREWR